MFVAFIINIDPRPTGTAIDSFRNFTREAAGAARDNHVQWIKKVACRRDGVALIPHVPRARQAPYIRIHEKLAAGTVIVNPAPFLGGKKFKRHRKDGRSLAVGHHIHRAFLLNPLPDSCDQIQNRLVVGAQFVEEDLERISKTKPMFAVGDVGHHGNIKPLGHRIAHVLSSVIIISHSIHTEGSHFQWLFIKGKPPIFVELLLIQKVPANKS